MQIFSNPDRDVSTNKPEPGSYEWWYFDAISDDGEYSFVIIFYEGNPFSRRYIDALESGKQATAEQYPAVSISIYKRGEPIFYSFEEVCEKEASFSTSTPSGRVKNNSFELVPSANNTLHYSLTLDQVLPNGDRLKGNLVFKSMENGPFDKKPLERDENHQWNLVQPSAEVSGELILKGLTAETISFQGRGYHDHNAGMEPMKESFTDWYWGRFHFNGLTLVYYLMNKETGRNDCAWLIDSANKAIRLDGEFTLSDLGLNVFGLKSSRKIELNAGRDHFLIQQDNVLDDGPFYQRFSSRLTLSYDGQLYQAKGISEYISPERIYMKLFRPLVNMRIQYPGKAHWVQKSPRLYRWTW